MKCDYDRICEALDEDERATFAQVPAEIWAPLNDGEQCLDSNDALLSALVGFLKTDIVSAPYKLRQTAERIVHFICDAKKKGNEYFSSVDNLNRFKSKFKVKLAKQPEKERNAEMAPKANDPQDKKLTPEAEKILRQSLFRSFYSMLTPKHRGRLASFMEEQKLCDEPLSLELRERINDEVVHDEANVETLLIQVEKGGLNCFLWLHGMLFEFFNGIMDAEERNEELNRQIDRERKQRAETATGPPQIQIPVVTAPAGEANPAQPEPNRENLELEVAKLKSELAAKEELISLKMEAEKSKLISEYERQITSLKLERQAFETECLKIAEDKLRWTKQACFFFEAFLDTLPLRYSKNGYTQLKSLLNEAESNLEAVQAKERKYASAIKEKPAQDDIRSPIKTAMWIAIALLAMILAAYSGFLANQKLASHEAETHSKGAISRLDGMRLDSMEDIGRAYDALKPAATNDEIQFLNDKAQALQKARSEESKK